MARSPVIEALANSHLNEQRRVIAKRESDLAARVHQVVGPHHVTDGSLPSVFWSFCQQHGVPALPARPSTCAAFCLDLEHDLGAEKLLDLLAGVSRAHVAAGLADPTASWQVNAVMARFAKTETPRSWTEEDRVEFLGLPAMVREIVLRREGERDNALQRALQKVADERKQLK